MENLRFVIDKSDRRNEYMLKSLQKDNYNAEIFDETAACGESGSVFVFAPSTKVTEKIIGCLPSGCSIFCLKCEEALLLRLKEKNITVYKFFDDEVLAMRNAYLTAEGTLAYIIQNTDITLRNMQVLVLGYGRVGKSVAKILHDNRCAVTVATNDPAEYAFASIYADSVCTLDNYSNKLPEFSVIVNTVPCLILKGEKLKYISKECFIIDLASLPGGVDFAEAKNLGLKTMHALGIPGKFAPKTAGEDIKKSILNILLKK